MMELDQGQLLKRFLAAHTVEEFSLILKELGDRDDLSYSQIFAPYGLVWKTYGEEQSNISTINIATKPGRSLAERVTNGVDALFAERAATIVAEPKSAREAAERWFARPFPIRSTNTRWYRNSQVDRRINLVILNGNHPERPTVDVMDDGSGIKPEDLRETILSLHQGNKIDKFYQVGLFGQGGSASLGFCTYVLIVSRHAADPKRVGFTIIRILRLDDRYKEDCYAYLAVQKDLSSPISMLTAEVDGPISIYKSNPKTRCPDYIKGTLVRHVGYRLEGLDKDLQASPGNLWHYLNAVMFDPLLPFRILDLRDKDLSKHKNELIAGSRTRLVGLATSDNSETEIEGTREVKYYRDIEYVAVQDGGDPCIAIELWAVFAYRKRKGGGQGLRPQSSELYVQSNHPIVFTLNGQNQGELTGQFLKESGIPLLSKHMIVHIDATLAHKSVRRELFSTTREDLKDGPIKNRILEYLRKMIVEDRHLALLEKELTDKLAKHEAQETRAEVKDEVTRLLKEAGLEVKDPGNVDGRGEGEPRPVPRERPYRPIIPDPLPTLPFPQVSKWEMVWPTEKLSVHLNDFETVIIETDADSQYEKEGRISIRSEPPKLEMAGKSLLRGGRVRWRMRPISDAQVGTTGEIITAITRPDGSQLVAQVKYEILPALERQARKKSGAVPPFEIVRINPESPAWEQVWPDDFWPEVSGDNPLEASSVAYKILRVQGKTIVYYSEIFAAYKDALDYLKVTHPAHLETFRTSYEIWIAYHAILQEREKSAEVQNLNELESERILESERQTVARVQAKQALREISLRIRLQKEKA